MADITLLDYLDRSAKGRPEHPAIEAPGAGATSYRDLDHLSNQLRDRLVQLGVGHGDRVGLALPKSVSAVAAVLGILKSGAAYVPVDASGPVARNAFIFSDCGVKAVLVEDQLADRLKAETARLGHLPAVVAIEPEQAGGLAAALGRWQLDIPVAAGRNSHPTPDDLAYILYTSGSTGQPKGVMLSHQNATSFIDWCSDAFRPTAGERFSSHAPLHFDLSILDLYLPLKHGATVVLIGEDLGKEPARLASLIEEARLTSWYSTPSVLSLLVQFGRLERHDLSSLQRVLFAGEVFPLKHLRELRSMLPAPRYFNLYGPTETNVCTFFEVPPVIPDERTEPFPIGRACSHLEVKAIDERGNPTPPGSEGELVVRGPAVMQGYWNLPDRTESAFFVEEVGKRWYRTGDIVVEEADGNYRFVGRRDRMVKRRGYRIELGEIEAGLYRHPAVEEVAVIALTDADAGTRIKAVVRCRDGVAPSRIELKRFCAEQLPLYMVPDVFDFQDSLPKTSTDKIDYQQLQRAGWF